MKLEKAATADVSPEARLALERAEGAYKEGRFADARAEYAALLALRPDLAPRIHQQIGFSWIQEKQHGKAVEELELGPLRRSRTTRRCARSPPRPRSREGWRRRVAELLAGLSEGVIKDPDAFFNIGVNFVSAGLTEDAAAYFTKAIGLDAAYVDGYYQRALAYLKLGRTAECRADFERVLAALAPDGPQAPLARKALQQLP